MGSNLSCVGCIDREHEEDALVPMNSYRAQYDENQIQGKQSIAGNSSEEALQAQLDAIRNAKQQSPSAHTADRELSEKINSIVKSRDCKVPDSLDIALQHRLNAIKNAKAERASQSSIGASDLQGQINAIVGSHAKSLKHQSIRVTDPTALCSPSPAKSFSDMDIASFAELALANAKERATPGKSPSALPVHWEGYENNTLSVDWAAYGCDFSPCELPFADGVKTLETENDGAKPSFTPYEEEEHFARCQLSFAEAEETQEPQNAAVPTALVEHETYMAQPKVSIVVPKEEPRPFDISEIPSPTRNRSKREQWALVEDALEEVATSNEKCEQQAAALEEARFRQERKSQQAAEEMEERLRMDKVCVDTFLESVTTCAWKERVRTPIKGSNLYVKHIRPARASGTSVDVKDSSFMNLGNFLRFLEGEGLLRLRPGVSDPVVTEIRFNLCSSYQYVRQGAPMQVAPHEAGCSCRKCTPIMPSWQ